ncbi:hypothetical protein HanIR_Chr09g0421411 [Helianthus annuus]|nr:hypothetical protein HanIR_Chr09g0421411 [Helianthus annuus]
MNLQMWAWVIQKSKDGGLEFHKPVRGQVYFLYIYLFVCLFIYDFSRILKQEL